MPSVGAMVPFERKTGFKVSAKSGILSSLLKLAIYLQIVQNGDCVSSLKLNVI
jgi:hypothetical protein